MVASKKELNFMGESNTNAFMYLFDEKIMPLYHNLPLTYYWLYRKAFGSALNSGGKVTVLDLGCGDGRATQNLNLPSNFEITGVDIYEPYIKIARKRKVYNKIIKKDVRRYNPKSKFDIVVASHILEHMTKKEGREFIKKMEKLGKKRTILAVPIGHIPQADTDGNKYQKHKASWSVNDMKKLGYDVKSQGFKMLWGDSNVVYKFGIFSYVLFIVSYLLSPILLLMPELGTYMVCSKCIREK